MPIVNLASAAGRFLVVGQPTTPESRAGCVHSWRSTPRCVSSTTDSMAHSWLDGHNAGHSTSQEELQSPGLVQPVTTEAWTCPGSNQLYCILRFAAPGICCIILGTFVPRWCAVYTTETPGESLSAPGDRSRRRLRRSLTHLSGSGSIPET